MLLLDTCAVLWLASGSPRLSRAARDRIGSARAKLHVSAISGLEIALKHARGALTLPLEPTIWITRAVRAHDLLEIPVSLEIGARSALLPAHHRDPFDRVLVATAQLRGLPIVTPDPLIAAYDVDVCW